jgi:hypothetical protein
MNGKQVRFKTERIMVPFEEGDNPELEPLFANHFEVARINSDVYLDIGMIRPSEMVRLVEAYTPGAEPTLAFHVLQRVAMTPQTLDVLRDKINELCDQSREGLADNASTDTAPQTIG